MHKKLSFFIYQAIPLVSLGTQITAHTITKFKDPRDALPLIKPYLPQSPSILEAGAYDGADSLFLSQVFPSATIFSFEPIPELYQKTCQKVRRCSRIHPFNYALDNKTGPAIMYISNHEDSPHQASQSSSLLPPKEHLTYAPFIQFRRKADVQCITIDEWAQAHNVDHIDFMWLDLQGNELKALQGAERIIDTVRAIILEVEFVEAYDKQPMFEEIKAWLERKGFTLIAFSDTNKWFGDTVFVRK